MVTSVPSVATGDFDTAARQNSVATAIGEIQGELQIPSYRQSVSGAKTLVTAAAGGGWTWPDQGSGATAYVHSGTGIIVPSTGAYVVTLLMYYAATYSWGRMLADLYYTSRSTATQIGRGTAQMGVGEQIVSISGITPILTGGSSTAGLVLPLGYQDSGGTITLTSITCTISPIPNIV